MSERKSNNNKIWTKDFILLWIVGMFLSTCYYVMLSVFPLYADSINLNPSDLGYLVSVYTFSALIIRPFTGFIIDKNGRKFFFIISLFLFSFFMEFYSYFSSIIVLVFLRLIHGISWGMYSTSGSTITADILPNNRRGEGVGYYMLTLSVAMAFGPAVSFKLLKIGFTFAYVFRFALILGFLGLIFSFFIKYPKIENINTKFSFLNIFEKKVLQLSVTMFFVAITYATIISFVSLYAKNISLDAAGYFFTVYAIVIAIVRPFSGKYLDKHGPKLIVTSALFIMGLGYLFMYLFEKEYSFIVGGALVGFGSGVVLPSLSALVANRVPNKSRGKANGTFFTSIDLGIGFGALVLGFLSDYFGVEISFGVSFIISWIAMLYFYFFVIRKNKYQAY